MDARDAVPARLRALVLSCAPILIVGCSCPQTSFKYDRTIRLDPASTDADVQAALAAPFGAKLSDSICDALCSNGQGHDIEDCERTELDADPAVICHMKGADDCGGVGRRPPGLRLRAPARSGDPRGRYLARAAELEAASVHAFARLARELSSYSAPEELVNGAHAAALEELEHAGTMARLARRYGTQPRSPRVRALALRSAFEMALDNAVEGCVYETLGALTASFQAEHAHDMEVRHALLHIALEELGHAELSWKIASWFEEVASERERRRVRRARDKTVARLRAGKVTMEPRVMHSLGVPNGAQHRVLIDRLREAVWT